MFAYFQFSLRDLLAVVAFVAIGLTALFNANGWWEGGLWAFALLALALACTFLVCGRGATRAFWLGFTVFGWFYLAMFLSSQMPSQTQTWIRNDALQFDRLIVTRLANWGYFVLLPQSRTQDLIPVAAGDSVGGMMGGSSSMGPPGSMGMSGGTGLSLVPNPKYVPVEHFLQIAHALFLLMIAAAGGKAAQSVWRSHQPARQASTPDL